MHEHFRRVQALCTANSPSGVTYSHDLQAGVISSLRRVVTYVAEPLNRYRSVLKLQVYVFSRFLHTVNYPSACRFSSAFGTADFHRFTSDAFGHAVAFKLTIRVHNPRHRLRVRVHVMRRYITLRSEIFNNET